MNDPTFTLIRDIRPLVRNLNLKFIVLEVGAPRRTRDGHDVRVIHVADQSGSINMTAWDEVGATLSAGDICKLANGYASLYRGSLTVNCKLDDLFKIGEFCMLFATEPNMSLQVHGESGARVNSGNAPLKRLSDSQQLEATSSLAEPSVAKHPRLANASSLPSTTCKAVGINSAPVGATKAPVKNNGASVSCARALPTALVENSAGSAGQTRLLGDSPSVSAGSRNKSTNQSRATLLPYKLSPSTPVVVPSGVWHR